MAFLDVVPLVHLARPFPQVLTYASGVLLPPGALVRVPLRHRSVLALVVTQSNSASQKRFRIKPIDEAILPHPIIPRALLLLAWWLADYYMSSRGLVLRSMLPSYILSRKGEEIASTLPALAENMQPAKPDKTTLVIGNKRFAYYQKILLRITEQGRKTLVLIPEHALAESFIKEVIPKHITPDVLSSEQTSLQFFRQWAKIRSGETRIVIGTRSAAFSPFPDLGCIIVEREGSSAYKSEEQHPRYQAQTAVLKLAQLTGAELIYGDTLPSLESFEEVRKKSYRLIGQVPSMQKPTGTIIDMRKNVMRISKKSGFGLSALSSKTLRTLEKVLKTGGRAILFVNRKGIATTVLCPDCGFLFTCSTCEAPLVAYREDGGERLLRCHHCGRRSQPPKSCPQCRNWRLQETGVAVQRVEQELRAFFPDAGVFFRFDRLGTPTLSVQQETLRLFSETPGGVLVTTQMLFAKFLSVHANLGTVVSADQLFYRPDFRSGERAFRMLAQLRGFLKPNAQFFIQSYQSENPLLRLAAKGDTRAFFIQELKERREHGYPPFRKLIKLSFSHRTNDIAKKHAEDLYEKLRTISGVKVLGPAPAFITKVRGKYIWHILLKFREARAAAIKQKLLTIVPPSWDIDVDPESIL